jgi:phospholipid/cholesterol/gamma-HCH transport system permease protein
MGPKSLPLIIVSAIIIAIALTLQTVGELRRFGAQDLSGAIIIVGLLREFGPLTISIAWGAACVARLSCEGRAASPGLSDGAYARGFMLPNLLASYSVALPLSLFGLLVGFLSAAYFAPTVGVSSTSDFMEQAWLFIQDKDLVSFFLKLALINPTVAVLIGCAYGNSRTSTVDARTEFDAVSVFFMVAYTTNLICTYGVFGRG